MKNLLLSVFAIVVALPGVSHAQRYVPGYNPYEYQPPRQIAPQAQPQGRPSQDMRGGYGNSYGVQDTGLASNSPKGLYMQLGFLGVALDPNIPDPIAAGLCCELNFDYGVGVTAAVGTYVPNTQFRGELEFAYRLNDMNPINFGSGNGNFGGSTPSYAMMLNGYYDAKQYASGRISPYIGGGAGYAMVDGEDGTLAYQFIVGADYVLNSTSSLVFDYRYFVASGLTLETDNNTPFEFDYETHNLMVGYRINLN